ncbi:hypothetical protein WJX77_006801 [Trebouxia sp. C0004]
MGRRSCAPELLLHWHWSRGFDSCFAWCTSGVNRFANIPEWLGKKCAGKQVNSLQSFVSVRELQWGTDTDSFGPPFDVIIASDLLYDMRSIPDLMLTIVSLSSSDTVTYLAFEVRPHVIRAAFQAMEAYGLKAEEVTQSQLHPDWQSDDIRVFKLKLPQLGL